MATSARSGKFDIYSSRPPVARHYIVSDFMSDLSPCSVKGRGNCGRIGSCAPQLAESSRFTLASTWEMRPDRKSVKSKPLDVHHDVRDLLVSEVLH